MLRGWVRSFFRRHSSDESNSVESSAADSVASNVGTTGEVQQAHQDFQDDASMNVENQVIVTSPSVSSSLTHTVFPPLHARDSMSSEESNDYFSADSCLPSDDNDSCNRTYTLSSRWRDECLPEIGASGGFHEDLDDDTISASSRLGTAYKVSSTSVRGSDSWPRTREDSEKQAHDNRRRRPRMRSTSPQSGCGSSSYDSDSSHSVIDLTEASTDSHRQATSFALARDESLHATRPDSPDTSVHSHGQGQSDSSSQSGYRSSPYDSDSHHSKTDMSRHRNRDLRLPSTVAFDRRSKTDIPDTLIRSPTKRALQHVSIQHKERASSTGYGRKINIHDHDVLQRGRGRSISVQLHAGNINYAHLIQRYCKHYTNSINDECLDTVIRTIQKLKPKGRFLKYDESYQAWYTMSAKDIRKKVQNSFYLCVAGKGFRDTSKMQNNDVKFDENMKLFPIEDHPGNEWLISKIDMSSIGQRYQNKQSELISHIFEAAQVEKFPPIRFLRQDEGCDWLVMLDHEVKQHIASMISIHAAILMPKTPDEKGHYADNLTEVLQDNDVQIKKGPGKGKLNHPGNIFYRQLIDRDVVKYAGGGKEDRERLADGIIGSIRDLTPPGRFMQPWRGKWRELHDGEVNARIQRALLYRMNLSSGPTLTFHVHDVKCIDNEGSIEMIGHEAEEAECSGSAWLMSKIQEYSGQEHRDRKEKSVIREIMAATKEKCPPIRFLHNSKTCGWKELSQASIEKLVSRLLQSGSDAGTIEEDNDDVGDHVNISEAYNSSDNHSIEMALSRSPHYASKKRSRSQLQFDVNERSGETKKRNQRMHAQRISPNDARSERQNAGGFVSSKKEHERKCVTKLRELFAKEMISEESKMRNLLSMALSRYNASGQSNLVRIAHDMLCFDKEDESFEKELAYISAYYDKHYI